MFLCLVAKPPNYGGLFRLMLCVSNVMATCHGYIRSLSSPSVVSSVSRRDLGASQRVCASYAAHSCASCSLSCYTGVIVVGCRRCLLLSVVCCCRDAAAHTGERGRREGATVAGARRRRDVAARRSCETGVGGARAAGSDRPSAASFELAECETCAAAFVRAV